MVSLVDAPLLEVGGLSMDIRTAQGTVRPVREVNLSVAAGEIVGVVGESGSGKTLMSLALTGMAPPRATVSGSVRFGGREILGLDRSSLRTLRGRRFGYVFQDPQAALNPLMTCGDQVTEALRTHLGLSRPRARSRVTELFASVGLSDPARCAGLYPHELSGGMRQRVMIAIAICCDPSVIIADEPTTALDVVITTQVMELLRAVCARTGAGMMFISHDLKLVSSLADRMVVMYGGRVVESGPTAQIMDAPGHAYTRALIEAAPDLFGPRARRFVGIDEQDLQAATSGVVVAPSVPDEAPANQDAPAGGAAATDEQVLTVSDLSVRYARRGPAGRITGAVDAVREVSASVRRREILGIVGESGSGKSSLARALVGLLAPSAGEITYRGTRLFPPPGRGRYRPTRAIQMVFQDPYASLNPRMRVVDLVAEALDIAGMRRRSPQRAEAVVGLLRRVNIDPELRHRYPHEFSGGQRQRIAIARALAARPDLLVCDEAVSSLDMSIRAHVLNVLAAERDRSGLSIVFIGHDLTVIRHLADRVVVMRDGRVVEQGPTEQVIFQPTHDYTRELVRASNYGASPIEEHR